MDHRMHQPMKKQMTSGQNSTSTWAKDWRMVESARKVSKKISGAIHYASKRAHKLI